MVYVIYPRILGIINIEITKFFRGGVRPVEGCSLPLKGYGNYGKEHTDTHHSKRFFGKI